jgi:hypothetical protein
MQLEPQVTFKNVDPSDAVLGQIQSHLDALNQRVGGITSCRVVFEQPLQQPLQRRHQADRYRIDLVVTLPGGLEVAVNRDAPEFSREDTKVAVREAFEIAEQRIGQVLSRRRDGLRYERPTMVEWEQPDAAAAFGGA